MEKTTQIFHHHQTFHLEAGGNLPAFQLKYTTLGRLNASRSNVVWVCHALTGSSDFTDWWDGLFTEEGPFAPSDNFIICANIIGGCYGSTGPLSLHPETGQPYYHEFPTITNRDVVNAFDLLRESLGLKKVDTLIGGSLGGQQVLEWAISRPEVFDKIVTIASNAIHSPWGIAFNEAQRMAIEADPTWKESEPRAGIEGMKAARAIGMLSYRQYETFQQTQSEHDNEHLGNFRAASYQRYQGSKLANRFNAYTYYLLTQMMDSHNVGRNRGEIIQVLGQITAKTLVVGIASDLLFPLAEQRFIANHIPEATLAILKSDYGHDGFLVEYDQLNDIIKRFNKTIDLKISA